MDPITLTCMAGAAVIALWNNLNGGPGGGSNSSKVLRR